MMRFSSHRKHKTCIEKGDAFTKWKWNKQCANWTLHKEKKLFKTTNTSMWSSHHLNSLRSCSEQTCLVLTALLVRFLSTPQLMYTNTPKNLRLMQHILRMSSAQKPLTWSTKCTIHNSATTYVHAPWLWQGEFCLLTAAFWGLVIRLGLQGGYVFVPAQGVDMPLRWRPT